MADIAQNLATDETVLAAAKSNIAILMIRRIAAESLSAAWVSHDFYQSFPIPPKIISSLVLPLMFLI